MDYELAKLEEMNTWSDIEESNIPQDKANPTRHVGTPRKESGVRREEILIKMGSERGSTKDEPVSE